MGIAAHRRRMRMGDHHDLLGDAAGMPALR